MIQALKLLDDGFAGKKGDIIYFVENENGLVNRILCAMCDSKNLTPLYKAIWWIVSHYATVTNNYVEVYHEWLQ